MTVNMAGVHSRIYGQSDSWGGAFGFQGGVEALVPFNMDFPLTAWGGFNVSMQGARYEEDYGEGLMDGTTRLWYMNFPLTARYPFGDGFYGEAGFQPGILLSAKDKLNGESSNYRDYIKSTPEKLFFVFFVSFTMSSNRGILIGVANFVKLEVIIASPLSRLAMFCESVERS